ncbi:splicing factor YJU2-like [Anopheles albimanus]|uniref:Splicing factor YJU2 n=1 Tax=Anopheles albimanus TaxID=7167 RepID=A0A182FU58_ANOAL|nr:splicing factor YJU2-like [Anopheles albimanus]
MSERKVLNKYYPPDFDPSKIPRVKLPKNRQYTVRLMAPFNMRCVTCGEYIYKGKKFNARKEDVENEDYLGIRIYRFYIKCTRCLQEISFKTDPRNTDYEIEAGATRNFMALKLAEEQARREEQEVREEEANNPMKLLENRTQQSRNEIELLESLEELKDLNRRQQDIDYDSMLQQFDRTESIREREERIERQDEEFIKSIKFQNKPGTKRIATEIIVEDVKEEQPDEPAGSSNASGANATTSSVAPTSNASAATATLASSVPSYATSKARKLDSFSIGVKKSSLSNLIVKKKPITTDAAKEMPPPKAPPPPVPPADKPVEADKAAATKPATTPGVSGGGGTGIGSLGLLGAYSDSESSDEN